MKADVQYNLVAELLAQLLELLHAASGLLDRACTRGIDNAP